MKQFFQISGKTLGADALAAVGSTSIIIYFVFALSTDLQVDLVSVSVSTAVQKMKMECAKALRFLRF